MITLEADDRASKIGCGQNSATAKKSGLSFQVFRLTQQSVLSSIILFSLKIVTFFHENLDFSDENTESLEIYLIQN